MALWWWSLQPSFMAIISQKTASNFSLHSTEEIGIAPCWIEASAFAWLAKQTLQGLSGNLPAVTGAAGKRILGGIFQA
jgi:anhydro-N-acetylmuramic acid kinase